MLTTLLAPQVGTAQTIECLPLTATAQVFQPTVELGPVIIITIAPTPSSQVFSPVGIITRQFIGNPGPVATNPQLLPYRKIKEPNRVNYRAIKRKRRERKEEEAMILFFMELFDESEDSNAHI